MAGPRWKPSRKVHPTGSLQLVYLSLGGVPLALAYKAVNTLDSMIGHLDARYEHFGWASPRLDDVLNGWCRHDWPAASLHWLQAITGQWHRIHESWYMLHQTG